MASRLHYPAGISQVQEDSDMKCVGMLLMVVATAGSLLAQTAPVPEIDPGSAATAVAMLSGALLILRSRKKK
jgi:hypothetical protein